MLVPVATESRGCGDRVAGGIYLVTGLSDRGRPPDEFLVDPPIPLGELEVSRLGQQIIQFPWTAGATVVDWVGSEHYLNVADFAEEVKRMGVSRRASRQLDWSKLGPDSRMVLVHERAIITNVEEYRQALVGQGVNWVHRCPTDRHAFQGAEVVVYDALRPTQMCVRAWWDDLEGGEELADITREGVIPLGRLVQRTNGSTIYVGRSRPEGVTPVYEPGIFASYPIHGIQIVRDEVEGTHLTAIEAVKGVRLSVEVTEA